MSAVTNEFRHCKLIELIWQCLQNGNQWTASNESLSNKEVFIHRNQTFKFHKVRGQVWVHISKSSKKLINPQRNIFVKKLSNKEQQ